jgi:SAM-dependent methyltransferase
VTRLDDRELYASEHNLRARQSIYANRAGPDARRVTLDVIAAGHPRRVLEVGGGQGELAEWMLRELHVERSVDQLERMVALARARGVDGQVGDVQQLPFEDGSFRHGRRWLDALSRPGPRSGDRGACTRARGRRPVDRGDDCEHHLRELLDPLGIDLQMTFSRENGDAVLRRSFSDVVRHDVDGSVTITDADAIAAYRDSTITSDTSREVVFDLPLRVATRVSIFAATK